MATPHLLYGSHASYYSATTRSYLRNKGIPFIEPLPSHPRFRAHVRPTFGSHRTPRLETPDGEALHDTMVVFDALGPLGAADLIGLEIAQPPIRRGNRFDHGPAEAVG